MGDPSGLIPTARLADPAADTVRLAGEARYRADSWEGDRRVVYEAKALPQGPNTRFVVTTRERPWVGWPGIRAVRERPLHDCCNPAIHA